MFTPPDPSVKRKAILVHVTTVPESLLGFLGGQIGFMKEQGFDIHAVSSPGKWLEKFAARERVAVHGVKMLRQITPLKDCATLVRLWRRLIAIRPHIVHSHTPKGGLLGMMAAWLARVPVRVYHIRGLPVMTAKGPKRFALWCAEKASCRLADRVFCISHSMAREAVKLGLCPTKKIRVLGSGGNGINAQHRFNPDRLAAGTRQRIRATFGIPADALVASFVGRIVRDKGMVELAGAWRKLRERFPTLHLLLVGPFEPQDPVPAEVEELFRNDPRIHLAGTVDDVSPYYAAMDVCVLPTYREGLPGVLLEAAAMELPVVATRVPGCVDAVVDGVTGTLVPPQNAAALAAAIGAYLIDPGLRRRHGLAGRQRVLSEFRRETIWQALYEEYGRLLQDKGLPAPAGCMEEAIPLVSDYLPKHRAA